MYSGNCFRGGIRSFFDELDGAGVEDPVLLLQICQARIKCLHEPGCFRQMPRLLRASVGIVMTGKVFETTKRTWTEVEPTLDSVQSAQMTNCN